MDTPVVDRFIRAMGWIPTDRLRDQVRAGLREVVGPLATRWMFDDGYETGDPKIDEPTRHRAAAQHQCARELRELVGMVDAAPAGFTVESFTGADGDHWWRVRHDNGHIVASSGEGYRNASHRDQMAAKLFPGLPVRVVRP